MDYNNIDRTVPMATDKEGSRVATVCIYTGSTKRGKWTA